MARCRRKKKKKKTEPRLLVVSPPRETYYFAAHWRSERPSGTAAHVRFLTSGTTSDFTYYIVALRWVRTAKEPAHFEVLMLDTTAHLFVPIETSLCASFSQRYLKSFYSRTSHIFDNSGSLYSSLKIYKFEIITLLS